MKKLSRIFFAVAALFAFSCTTDTTEDLSLSIKGGGTELAISLEESRTQLGAKAEGVYPLYWSEGDKIAVNGVVSTALTAEEAGAAGALFTFESELVRPYNIVYPAPAEGVAALTEGQYPVTFLAEQEYTAGTFCAGAAPMYGYAAAETEGAIQLQHLTGVLRFAVKGEGVTLKQLAITSETGALAGTFDVDCATGALTAHDDASNTIKVTFGKGLTLGAEATPIYVAVPAGKYGKIYVMISSESDIMKLTFDSEAKPLNAGAVREFAEFTYAANSSESDIYVIDSKEALIHFAEIAANFAPYTTAKVVAPIDMTGVEWAPVEGFGGYIFDGGEFEIKGLSAPLFGSTAGIIKNVKLTDVAITLENPSGSKGALVCLMSGGSINNCEVAGTLSVSAPQSTLAFGGVVGYATGEATISHVVNRCAVSVDISNNKEVFIGGVLGLTAKPLSITYCDNYGALTLTGEDTATVRIGGIIGYISSGGTTTAEYLNNHAVLTTTHKAGADAHIGGVFGSIFAKSSINNSYNKPGANLYVYGVPGSTSIGGIAGYGSSALDIDTCENSGNISFSYEATTQTMIGGIYGFNNTTSSNSIKNVTNHGSITVEGSNTNHIRTGGVIGYSHSNTTLENLTNNGAINVSASSKAAFCGGVIAYAGSNTGTNIINNGTVTYSGAATGEQLRFGGCIAYANGGSYKTMKNNATATLTLSGTSAKSAIHAGGVVGQNTSEINGAENHATISFGGSAGTMYYAGGVVGSTTKALTSLTNEGSVTFNGTAVQNHNVGGVVGKAECTALTTLENKAAVTFAGQTTTGTKPEYSDNTCTSFGGVVGVVMGTADARCEVSGLTNSGVTTIGALNKGLKTGYSNLGGVIGYAIYCNLDNCDNTATEFKQEATATIYKLEYGSNKHGVYIGGVAGYCNEMGTIENCDNSATLNLNANNAIHHYIGGLFGLVETSSATFVEVSKCSNSGNFAPGATFTTKRFRLGGVAGTNKSVNYTQCSNSGIISYTPSTLLTNQFYCGGLFGVLSGGGATSCINTGDITLGKNTTTSSATTYIGGLVGSNSGNCKDSHSLCDMTIDGEWVNTGARIGGVVGTTSTPLDNVTVFCNISAIDRSGKVGMVEGIAYAEASKATNCKIGGKIATTTTKYEDSDGVEVVGPLWVELSDTNYFDYMYGGTTDWTGVENYDGCSFLSVVPEV
ncbi:MAG: hypothetical protein J6C94_07255 [Alistipes sp.]|nr:hypothetical protein [Alistipes sp.]